MKIQFLKKFYKDLDKISKAKDKEAISNIIETIKKAKSLEEIPHIKKLSGFHNAYRIRLGNYRIGIFYENEIIVFARIAHRKEIYRIFP